MLLDKRYRDLPTERAHPAARDLDTRSVPDILSLLLREDARVAEAVRRQRAPLARAVGLLLETLRGGGRLFFIGAGTSGRLGVLEAAECPPTFGTAPSQVRALMAGGRSAVFRSKEGAEDDARAAAAQVARLARPGDMLVGIAASGVTPFVRAALDRGRRLGARTVLVTCNPKAAAAADVVIAPRVGPEVLSGSTRLKAASAAKLVLNALTTAAMVRLGKAYGHWMVDLRPASRKLRQRSLRIVRELGLVGEARAARLLAACAWRVPVAVLMARGNLSAARSRARLKASGGFLRKALEGL